MLLAHPPENGVLVARSLPPPVLAIGQSSWIAAHPLPRAVTNAPSALDSDPAAPSLVVAFPP